MTVKKPNQRTLRLTEELDQQVADLAEATNRQYADIVRAAVQLLFVGGAKAAERRLSWPILGQGELGEELDRAGRSRTRVNDGEVGHRISRGLRRIVRKEGREP